MPDQAPARSANGKSNSHFAATRDRAHQQKIRDVCTCKKQDNAGDSHQKKENRVEIIVCAKGTSPKRIGGDDVIPLMRIRILADNLLHQSIHFGLSLFSRDARLEACGHHEPAISTAMQGILLRPELPNHRDGNPHVGAQARLSSLEDRRCDTDNRVGMLINLNRAADNGAFAAEMRPPEAIADDNHRHAAGLGVFDGQKTTPENRPDAKRREVVRGAENAPNALRLGVRSKVHRREARSNELGKALIAAAQIDVIWI